ncbi:MAG TPA: DUF2892 domain-containing protein [Pseudoneobacillus sp.]|nr:DUF2892 domain-containing protein [Pseudoneobacillus sp.]
MKIKPNIGIISALIRITCGLTILAWSTSKLVKFPWRDSYLITAVLGAMKVAEGIVRYCPVVDLFERMQEQCTDDHTHHNADGDPSEASEVLPYNPT